MITMLFTHPACLGHDAGAHHPERPARLAAILRALDADEFAELGRVEAPRVDEADLLRAHAAPHVAEIRAAIPEDGELHHIDPDTAVGPRSWEAIERAAGGVVAAVDAVARGECRNAFCAVRPPGHHAERDAAMGFCLFNNVAVAALHARAVHGLNRVAVIDFDVHHGNGTQDIFWSDPDLFYASTHQWGAYPGTGRRTETGAADNVVNVPLAPGCTSSLWRESVTTMIWPKLRAFHPDMIIASAGFDAHEADPLAQMRLETEDFYWIGAELVALAADLCGGRLVSALEGGYDLEALAQSVAAHVRALMRA